MDGDDTTLQDLQSYAAAHGLSLEPGERLPRSTPLLASGELRSVDAVASGWLATYVEAKLAVITRPESRFTVALTHVPKAKRFVPWLLCHRVEDEGLLGDAARRLIGGEDRIDLESAELDRHYRIHASPERDDIWLHELFSPSFIVFLIERAPQGLAFEYAEGALCVSLVGSRTVAADLDALREATVELVGRFRGEIRERLGEARGRSAPAPPGWSDQPR
ncbi:MAG: hypothetical protein ACM3NV_09680 [Syntrophothermus sp.]